MIKYVWIFIHKTERQNYFFGELNRKKILNNLGGMKLGKKRQKFGDAEG